MRGRRASLREIGRRHAVVLALSLGLSAPPAALAAEKPLVLYFGGYGATEADMRLWEKAAAADPRHGQAFAFEAIPYPKDVDYNVLRAVAAASGTIEGVVARIRAMGDRRVILVGHSSGVAIAANIASRVGDLDTVKLISLDAGINTAEPPAPGSFPIREVECWAAESGGLTSFGFRRVRDLCGERGHVLHPRRCASPICLHFSLVNRRVAEDLTWTRSRAVQDGVSGGYRNLAIELGWLDRSR